MDLPPSSGPVDQVFRDHQSLKSVIGDQSPSDLVALDTTFRKILVLSAASHLEALMTFHMNEYFATLGSTPHEFIRRFALDRKFFQWFDFDSPMPAKFFKFFGAGCHEIYKSTVESNSSFEAAARSFLVLCSTRNILIHQNLAEATFEMTPDEIEEHFRRAIEFPDLAMRVVKASGV